MNKHAPPVLLAVFWGNGAPAVPPSPSTPPSPVQRPGKRQPHDRRWARLLARLRYEVPGEVSHPSSPFSWPELGLGAYKLAGQQKKKEMSSQFAGHIPSVLRRRCDEAVGDPHEGAGRSPGAWRHSFFHWQQNDLGVMESWAPTLYDSRKPCLSAQCSRRPAASRVGSPKQPPER